MKINHFYAADDFTGEQCVLLSDHIASHAYDEVKERELFEEGYRKEFEMARGYKIEIEELVSMRDGDGYGFDRGYLNGQWVGWKSCAKSRARSAE